MPIAHEFFKDPHHMSCYTIMKFIKFNKDYFYHFLRDIKSVPTKVSVEFRNFDITRGHAQHSVVYERKLDNRY